MQKRRTAERIPPAAVHASSVRRETREIAVLGEQIEIVPYGLLDVILEHGDDQLVLAPEIRIERLRVKPAAAAMASMLAPPIPCSSKTPPPRLVQLFAGIVPGGSGSNS